MMMVSIGNVAVCAVYYCGDVVVVVSSWKVFDLVLRFWCYCLEVIGDGVFGIQYV
jgi:hypothetical protein